MAVRDARQFARLRDEAEAAGSANPAAANRRQSGRLLTDELQCNLGGLSGGCVLDLSAGGLRVSLRTLAGISREDVVDVTLTCGPTKLRLRARVAWTKRMGLMRMQVGLEFLNADPEQIRTLHQMATLARRLAG